MVPILFGQILWILLVSTQSCLNMLHVLGAIIVLSRWKVQGEEWLRGLSFCEWFHWSLYILVNFHLKICSEILQNNQKNVNGFLFLFVYKHNFIRIHTNQPILIHNRFDVFILNIVRYSYFFYLHTHTLSHFSHVWVGGPLCVGKVKKSISPPTSSTSPTPSLLMSE